MLFYHKQCLSLAIIFSFASISNASLNQSHDDFAKQTVKVAKEHFKQGKHQEAVESLKGLLEIGNADAQCLLGVIYIDSDSLKAAEWLEKSALQGHSDAQYFLASLYLPGLGVKQDITKAMFWLEKTAEQNNSAAQYLIGLIYYNGTEIQQNYQKAFDWFSKSADQNDAHAQYQLGIMYFKGLGIPQNYLKAADFFNKAAIQGDSDAQFELGIMLIKGEGIEKDYPKAVEWIKKSAKQGKADAQYCLGMNYQHGFVGKADPQTALYWLLKATDQGNAKAIQALKEYFSPFQELYNVSFPVDEIENWKIGYGCKSQYEYLIEFVPLHETVNDWSELFTFLFMSNEILKKDTRIILTFLETYKKSLRKDFGDQFKLNILQATENDALFESFMPNPSEYEIVRLIKTSKGIHRLSYTVKGSYKSEKNKEKWLKNIQEAHLINF